MDISHTNDAKFAEDSLLAQIRELVDHSQLMDDSAQQKIDLYKKILERNPSLFHEAPRLHDAA